MWLKNDPAIVCLKLDATPRRQNADGGTPCEASTSAVCACVSVLVCVCVLLVLGLFFYCSFEIGAADEWSPLGFRVFCCPADIGALVSVDFPWVSSWARVLFLFDWNAFLLHRVFIFV